MSDLPQDDERANSSHWQLLRDVVSFQFKLAMDGIRDIVLSPASIGSALWGIITSPSNPGKYFYKLLQLGHRSDKWINLFGDIDHYEEGQQTSDKYVHKAQDLIIREYNKDGVVRKLKDNTDGFLDRIQKK